MLLEIKRVKECRDGSFGYFKILGRQRACIAISEKKNPTLDLYAETLLHELLHCYTALLQAEGFKVTDGKEHKWIEDCETQVIELMKKHIGGK
jgi:hypothetical protein